MPHWFSRTALFTLAPLLLLAHAVDAQMRVTPGAPHRPARGPAPRCERLFDAPIANRTGVGPAALEFADLDGDQNDDLVVADIGGDEVCVFLGRGQGRFRTRVEYDLPASSDPRDMAVVDVTGDGHRDVVVLCRGSGEIRLLEGVGDGTLLPSVVIDTVAAAFSNDLASGDLDGDGDVDLVMTISGITGGLRILRNLAPTGWSGRNVPAQVAFATPSCLALADLDGDLDLDIALPSYESTGVLRVYSNPGNGVFGEFQTFAAGDRVGRIRAGDADGDGDVDLFVSNYRVWPAPSAFSVLVNTGGGAFPSRVEFATGVEAFHFDLGDIDHDGLLDIAIASEDADSVYLHRNVGGLNFVLTDLFRIDLNPWEVLIRDIDGDGIRDLAACANGGDGVFGFLATSPGVFVLPTIEPTVALSRGAVAGDLTGDGFPEVVTTHQSPANGIGVHPNQNGVLGQPVQQAFTPYPRRGEIFDFDQDGLPDIVALRGPGGQVGTSEMIWQRNTGGGVFAPPVFFDTFQELTTWALGDLDQDGDTDFIASLGGFSTGISMFWNQGGTFTSVPVPAPAEPGEFQIEDFDGDGRPDIACALSKPFAVATDPQGLHVQWNLGAGVLTPLTQVTNPVPTAPACRGVIATDVDRDGDVDLIAGPMAEAGSSTAIPYVAYNNGSGVFTPRLLTPTPPYSTTDMALGDCDHDGVPEIVLTGIRAGGAANTSVVMVYKRNGAGDYELEWTYGIGTYQVEVVAADFDRDNDTDLLLHPIIANRPMIKLRNHCR